MNTGHILNTRETYNFAFRHARMGYHSARYSQQAQTSFDLRDGLLYSVTAIRADLSEQLADYRLWRGNSAHIEVRQWGYDYRFMMVYDAGGIEPYHFPFPFRIPIVNLRSARLLADYLNRHTIASLK